MLVPDARRCELPGVDVYSVGRIAVLRRAREKPDFHACSRQRRSRTSTSLSTMPTQVSSSSSKAASIYNARKADLPDDIEMQNAVGSTAQDSDAAGPSGAEPPPITTEPLNGLFEGGGDVSTGNRADNVPKPSEPSSLSEVRIM